MRAPSRGAAMLAVTLVGTVLQAGPATGSLDPVPVEPEQPGDKTNSPTAGTYGVGNVAHRGYSVAAPENTMEAVRQAVAEQGDFQGIDVHRTRDSRLVVLHDTTLARTTNVEQVYPRRDPWRVRDFTFEELSRLDAGSWFHGSYSGSRIPSLATMLSALNKAPSGVFLEVKNPSENPGVGDQVVQVIRDNTDWMQPGGTDHRLVVQSFDEGFLERLHDKYPNIPVGALGGYRAADLGWLDQINVNHTELSAAEVDRAHETGTQVSTYVVDDRDRMRQMLDAGVDAISTNRPRLLNEVLTERGLDMPHPESDAERASYVGSQWRASAPDSARLATRVPVGTTFRDEDGNPVRWSWATLQTYYAGSWHDIQQRATGADGTVSTSLWLRRDIKVRWAPWREAPTGAEPSGALPIDARRAATVVHLGGRDRIRRGSETQLSVRWRSEDGRLVTGRAALWARPRGADHWHHVRTRKVRDGHRSFAVQPRRTTRYQVRAESGWWWRGDRDSHRVVVRR